MLQIVYCMDLDKKKPQTYSLVFSREMGIYQEPIHEV